MLRKPCGLGLYACGALYNQKAKPFPILQFEHCTLSFAEKTNSPVIQVELPQIVRTVQKPPHMV